VDDLQSRLAAHRRAIRAARAREAALRWAFYASVLACVYLLSSRVGGLIVSRAALVTALVAVPLGMAAREWTRSFTLKDCAIYLDRALGLEERLSTAVEVPGAMGGAQAADAAGALQRLRLPGRPVPREAKLLPAGVLLGVALLVVPSPRRSGSADDPALEAAARAAAERLERFADEEPEAREVAGLLREGKAVDAFVRLRILEERLRERMLDGAAGSGSARERELLDAAAAGAAALGAELARTGVTVHAPPPRAAARKLERQPVDRPAPPREFVPESEGGVAGEGQVRSIAEALSRRDWDPRYDVVVRAYFGDAR
jgi:hypothetical protein